MIKTEWQFLVKHKFMLIVFCVIILIPSIYAVTFLRSMWDPYGELQNLPVAVVNHDRATAYEGQKLALGQKLTQNLKTSKALQFHEVSNDRAARQGLEQGKYYMVLTIPKNFSRNATTLLDKTPKKMVLHYDTSSGHNFFAGKITSSAAESIRSEVADQVTQTYAKTMFSSIQKLDHGLTSADEASQELANGGRQIGQANQQIVTNLDTLAQSTLTLDNGAQTLDQGLKNYIYGVTQLQAGNQQLQNGLTQLANQAPALVDGVTALSSGSQTLTDGTIAYVDGTQQIVQNIGTLDSGAQQLNNGLQQLTQNTAQLTTNGNSLATGSQNLAGNLQQLSNQSNQIATQLNLLSQNSATTAASTQALNTQINALDQTLMQLDGSQQNMVAVQNNLAQLQALTAASTQADTLTSQVAAAADEQGLTDTQKQAILATVQANDSATAQTTQVQQATANLATAIDTLATNLPSVANTPTPIATDAANQQASLVQLATATQQLAAGLNQAANGATMISSDFTTMNAGLPVLNQSITQLSQGSSQLANGAMQLNTGGQTLINRGVQLTDGAQNLQNGLDQLAQQAPTLTNGIQQLDQGSRSLSNGYVNLTQNDAALTNGMSRLSNGSAQLANGADELAAGAGQLTPAIDQVTEGNQTLAQQLGAAAKQAKVSPSKLTYEQVAKPVTTSHTELDRVPNNGTGMAPYMMCVSLFVGALALNMMFDMYTPRRFPDGPFGWWASKASIWVGFALVASLLMGGLVMLIDGLAPVRIFSTFGLLFLIGLTFMSIVVWLNLVLGKAGAFFSMVLLVLQLGSSAGTYPIQLSNGFFEALNPILPMSYGVHGLREALMIGGPVWPDIRVLLIYFTIFTFLSLLFFARRGARMKLIDFNDPLAVEATQNKLAKRLAENKKAKAQKDADETMPKSNDDD